MNSPYPSYTCTCNRCGARSTVNSGFTLQKCPSCRERVNVFGELVWEPDIFDLSAWMAARHPELHDVFRYSLDYYGEMLSWWHKNQKDYATWEAVKVPEELV